MPKYDEAKSFADDMSLFTVLHDVDNVADKLNRDLDVILIGPTIQFNPDKNKQAIQVIFSQRKDAVILPPVKIYINMNIFLINRQRI